jgi:large subunit ribosomal protein L25
MKSASLSGSPRENVGKKDAKALRAAMRVPGVLYGGKDQLHFHIEENALNKIVFTPDTYRLVFELGDQTVDCIIQDVQFHPVTDRITHVDLLQIFADKPVRVEIPVHSVGKSVGVSDGGRLYAIFRRLPVVGLADLIPDSIEGDITELAIGDSLRVSDFNVDGCTIPLNEDSVVLAVRRTRAAMASEDAEGVEGAEGDEGTEGSEGAEGGEGGEGDKK